MPPPALHAVFQFTAMAKVTYSAPAWWGFTNTADRNRLEAFIRRAVRHGYCAGTTPTLSSLCDKADQTLFDNLITSSTHPLHILLPSKVEKHYSTLPAATVINFHVKLLHLTKAISFIVYYIVTFCRLRLLIDISIFDV